MNLRTIMIALALGATVDEASSGRGLKFGQATVDDDDGADGATIEGVEGFGEPFPTPLATDTAAKTECLSGKGPYEGVTDFCGTCCPACTAVVVGTSSFTSQFNKDSGRWQPNAGFSGCVCLDLAESGYNPWGGSGFIDLTPSSDCARITGDGNSVLGRDGADAMYSNGVGNELHGWLGDDHLAAGGSGNYLLGGPGDGDVCSTDLSGISNRFSSTCETQTCLGPGGKAWPLDCATGNPPLPQIVECLRDDTIAEGDHCGTCCPACTPVVVGTSSFTSHFVKQGRTWKPNEDFSGCVCLDLDGDNYNRPALGDIDLTSSSDCARVTGDNNWVYGRDGNDAMYSNGVGNELIGMEGYDHLAAGGSRNWLRGYGGDVCTDFSGSNTFSSTCGTRCQQRAAELVIDREVVASRGGVLSLEVRPLEAYELRFTMAVTSSAATGNWQSIIHIGDTNSIRLPGIWFTRDGFLHVVQSSKLCFTPSVACEWGVDVAATDPFNPVPTPIPFQTGVTYDIQVVVQDNEMTVFVDDAVAGTATGSATFSSHAKVYVSDPWHAAAGVTLSKISYRSLELICASG